MFRTTNSPFKWIRFSYTQKDETKKVRIGLSILDFSEYFMRGWGDNQFCKQKKGFSKLTPLYVVIPGGFSPASGWFISLRPTNPPVADLTAPLPA
jgi:hypothetical protein